MKAGTEVRKPLFISRVYVEQLFGQFKYELGDDNSDLSKVLILYGDNGSGKTTILNCIFHLLSPSTDRGHRIALGRIPFHRFSVTLGSDTVVSAVREPGTVLGDFDMTVASGTSEPVSAHFEFDPSFKLVRQKKIDRSPLFSALKNLGLKFHFLSDDRKIVTDLLTSEEEHEDIDRANVLYGDVYRHYLHTSHLKRVARERESSLEQAIDRAVEWIRKQAITGAGMGDVNANTLYTDITRRIVSPYLRKTVQDKPQLESLIGDLKEQAVRSSSFAKFGLSTVLPADDLLVALESEGARNHIDLLHQILRPFIDGYKLRLNALASLHGTISTFVELINGFYQRKVVSFHLREGIAIKSASEQELKPNLLSSGEKQLLLLLCNVMAAGDEASVFIIDEPELSLNVKWQRKLVDALLDCTKNSQTQFVLATHSLELLTHHEQNVLKLEDKSSA
jgi:energy-coupling factor transporter ATP-binding protein EcfA2